MHFSPILRSIFSVRWAVFLGSVSFAVYLIHSFLMRSVLTWVIHGLIPQFATAGLISFTLRAIAFPAWMLMVIVLATIWRNRVDSWAGLLTVWVEEVMLGKRGIWDTFGEALNKQAKRTDVNSYVTVDGVIKDKVTV